MHEYLLHLVLNTMYYFEMCFFFVKTFKGSFQMRYSLGGRQFRSFLHLVFSAKPCQNLPFKIIVSGLTHLLRCKGCKSGQMWNFNLVLLASKATKKKGMYIPMTHSAVKYRILFGNSKMVKFQIFNFFFFR